MSKDPNFTINSKRTFEKETAEIANGCSAEQIIRHLRDVKTKYTFSDFIRRIIYFDYFSANSEKSINDIPNEEYIEFLKNKFSEKGIDHLLGIDMGNVGRKIPNIKTQIRQWLTDSRKPKRDSIFLIAFALNMTSKELDGLLTRGSHESGIYYNNYVEAISAYCLDKYHDGTAYKKADEYCKKYFKTRYLLTDKERAGTIKVKESLEKASDLNEIIDNYKLDYRYDQSESAKKIFLETLEKYKVAKSEELRMIFNTYEECNGYTPDTDETVISKNELDISTYSIEKSLYDGQKRNGSNLADFDESELSAILKWYTRLSRERIEKILDADDKSEAIRREDILVMMFHIIALELENEEPVSPQERLDRFVDAANSLLKECCLGQIYYENPYDCILMYCMVSDDPLFTYTQINNLSFQTDDTQKN